MVSAFVPVTAVSSSLSSSSTSCTRLSLSARVSPSVTKRASLVTSLRGSSTFVRPDTVSSRRRTTEAIHSDNNSNSDSNDGDSTYVMSGVRGLKSTVTVERLADKSYQLEEDEDDSSCTTAIFLDRDGTVHFGRTDGPAPDRVNAAWRFNSVDGEIVIDIERFFLGENNVEFMVKRVLRGHLDDSRKNLVDLPVFTGAMYPFPSDYAKHSEVGWFAMILATDDLPTDDFDIAASN